MLRVAVELPAVLATPGEFLADVRAYEAAGADAIWLRPESLEPLTLAAAAAAVTYQPGLGVWLSTATAWPPGLLAGAVLTLGWLAGGRLRLGIEGAGPDGLIQSVRAAELGCAVLVAGHSEDVLVRAARLGDGLVSDRAAAPDAFERVRALRRPSGQAAERADPFELWARVPAPGGRGEWREALAACEALGATGVLVAHAPNLLDILRNPEDDDRQDLAMAVG